MVSARRTISVWPNIPEKRKLNRIRFIDFTPALSYHKSALRTRRAGSVDCASSLFVTVHTQCNLVKQVRTPPVRPADGVVGCVYESFVPGVWHRWMEKEILWFCFRRAEPERMISGWTASSRDSSKTEEGKALRGYGQIRSELRMSSKLKLSRILPL